VRTLCDLLEVPRSSIYWEPKERCAFGTLEFWAKRNGCETMQTKLKSLDLVLIKWEILPDANDKMKPKGSLADLLTPGLSKETDTFTDSDCVGGTRTALWRIQC
jgi:hypothetical protein